MKNIHNSCNLISLRSGFQRFLKENAHYPSTDEVDSCPYLCSSKQIQRKFGGINKLRELLDIADSDYSSGTNRKLIYEKINRLSVSSENQVGDYLKDRYGVICVHEEKKYGVGKNRVDYFVYATVNFAVEVFNTYTLRNLLININSKLKKYSNFPELLFFVVTGASFDQRDIDSIIKRKKNTKYLTQNMRCVSFEYFKKLCNKIQPLKIEMPLQTNLFKHDKI